MTTATKRIQQKDKLMNDFRRRGRIVAECVNEQPLEKKDCAEFGQQECNYLQQDVDTIINTQESEEKQL